MMFFLKPLPGAGRGAEEAWRGPETAMADACLRKHHLIA